MGLLPGRLDPCGLGKEVADINREKPLCQDLTTSLVTLTKPVLRGAQTHPFLGLLAITFLILFFVFFVPGL